MALKTNYKDDVFSGNRKYREIINSDGTKSFEDVTQYTQSGDIFSAEDMNGICNAINSVVKTVTIQPSEWVGNCYTYKDSLITATSNQEFGDPEYTGSSDDAMFKALAKAQIKVGVQTVGQTKLYCLGKVPTIPVKFMVVFKGVK